MSFPGKRQKNNQIEISPPYEAEQTAAWKELIFIVPYKKFPISLNNNVESKAAELRSFEQTFAGSTLKVSDAACAIMASMHVAKAVPRILYSLRLNNKPLYAAQRTPERGLLLRSLLHIEAR